MTERKLLCNCMSDKGAVIINGVSFSGIGGDGWHKVYYVDEKPSDKELTKYEGVWIDLRDGNMLMICQHDCNLCSAVNAMPDVDCNALEVYHSNRNIYLIKCF